MRFFGTNIVYNFKIYGRHIQQTSFIEKEMYYNGILDS